MSYDPGRDVHNGWMPCQLNKDLDCPAKHNKCSGSYPFGCWKYFQINNFKASLSSVGVMNWGQRARMHKVEVHDFVVGPSFEVFDENTVNELHVTCRTSNWPMKAPHCGNGMEPHEGAQADVNCNGFDKRGWNHAHKVLTWYDTGTNTILTNASINKCDPKTWAWCGSGRSCANSRVVQFTSHSDQFLPEFMTLTAGFQFDSAERNYAVAYNTNSNSIAAKISSWLDADGSFCGHPEWGPSIIGSNKNTGSWWKFDDQCELAVSSRGDTWCVPESAAS